MRITSTHILIAAIVWYFDRRLALYKEDPGCDLIKDNIFPIKLVSSWWTVCIPLYLLFVNPNTSSNVNRIIEHCAAIYVIILMINMND